MASLRCKNCGQKLSPGVNNVCPSCKTVLNNSTVVYISDDKNETDKYWWWYNNNRDNSNRKLYIVLISIAIIIVGLALLAPGSILRKIIRQESFKYIDEKLWNNTDNSNGYGRFNSSKYHTDDPTSRRIEDSPTAIQYELTQVFVESPEDETVKERIKLFIEQYEKLEFGAVTYKDGYYTFDITTPSKYYSKEKAQEAMQIISIDIWKYLNDTKATDAFVQGVSHY